jgi:hypothetical protein
MNTRTILANVQGVYIGREEETFVTTPQDEVRVSFAGFEGDKHASLTMRSNSRTPFYPRNTMIRNSRQVTILSVEELAEIAARLGVPDIKAEWLGANLLVKGIPGLTFLPPGTRFFFPERAVLVVQAENNPCSGPGKVIQQHYPGISNLADAFVKTALHRRGVVAWVERPGSILQGDEVRVDLLEQVLYPPPGNL